MALTFFIWKQTHAIKVGLKSLSLIISTDRTNITQHIFVLFPLYFWRFAALIYDAYYLGFFLVF